MVTFEVAVQTVAVLVPLGTLTTIVPKSIGRNTIVNANSLEMLKPRKLMLTDGRDGRGLVGYSAPRD